MRATKAEAVLGIAADRLAAEPLCEDAYEMTVEAWMRDSAEEQRVALQTLLDDTPLKVLP